MQRLNAHGEGNKFCQLDLRKGNKKQKNMAPALIMKRCSGNMMEHACKNIYLNILMTVTILIF